MSTRQKKRKGKKYIKNNVTRDELFHKLRMDVFRVDRFVFVFFFSHYNFHIAHIAQELEIEGKAKERKRKKNDDGGRENKRQ